MLSSAISSSETFAKQATGSHFGHFLALYKPPGAVYIVYYMRNRLINQIAVNFLFSSEIILILVSISISILIGYATRGLIAIVME